MQIDPIWAVNVLIGLQPKSAQIGGYFAIQGPRTLQSVIAREPARRRTRIPGVGGIFPAMLTS
jgi:hypothetical protein